FRMKRVFLTLFVIGMAAVFVSWAWAQDTLLDFSDVEFTTGADTSTDVTEYIEVPDDVVFSDGQDVIDSAHDGAKLTAADSGADTGGSPRTLWGIFIAGIIGGFAAFLMPCIYPMVPLTVSYFTKQSGTRTKGIINALLYGLFIIVIYVALGMLVTLIFGASALNEAASSAWFNLLFFLIIIVFAISFLGAFEITLPSRFVNKMDEKS